MLRHLPNTITLINLFFGCIGIYACAVNDYQLVPYCMAAALLADFLDGYLARALKVKSDLGAQLDSLADNVTFGVLPGMMLLHLISMSQFGGGGSYTLNPLAYLGFAYSLFACLRLAKFNLDTRQTEGFIGMPTPAGGIFVLGLYLYFFEQDFSAMPTLAFKFIYQPWSLLAIVAGLSWLMISEIPMFSLKGNLLQWKGNQIRMVFLVISALMLLGLGSIGLTAVISLYVLISVIGYFAKPAAG
jgi:CDP-diacylglycerol---serine O-phosphatidyltransferase